MVTSLQQNYPPLVLLALEAFMFVILGPLASS